MEKIFILLDIPKKETLGFDELNNVYCYDYDGNILWQIKPPVFKEYPELGQFPITGIKFDYEKSKLFATDFGGRTFDVNLNNGELVDFTTSRF